MLRADSRLYGETGLSRDGSALSFHRVGRAQGSSALRGMKRTPFRFVKGFGGREILARTAPESRVRRVVLCITVVRREAGSESPAIGGRYVRTATLRRQTGFD